MVCKRIKRVLSIILLTVFIFTVFFVSVSATTEENTEDETEKQELIALAKDAHCMYLMLDVFWLVSLLCEKAGGRHYLRLCHWALFPWESRRLFCRLLTVK